VYVGGEDFNYNGIKTDVRENNKKLSSANGVKDIKLQNRQRINTQRVTSKTY